MSYYKFLIAFTVASLLLQTAIDLDQPIRGFFVTGGITALMVAVKYFFKL